MHGSFGTIIRLACAPILPVLTWVATAEAAHAVQSQEFVDPVVACPECDIRFDTITFLDDRDGPGILADEAMFELDLAAGRIFAIDFVAAPGRVSVFKTDGSHEGYVGRPGEGPGEFRFPWGFVRDGEAIATFDRRRGIIAWIGPDLAIERTDPFSHPIREAVALSDSVWISNSYITHPSVAGHPFHLVRGAPARLAGSFGQEGAVDLQADPTWVRHVARESESAFWSIPKNDLRIELWSIDGRRQRSIRYSAPWFDPVGWVEVAMEQPYSIPPFPEVSKIHRDECGFLWVTSWVPAADWSPVGDPGTWVESETQDQYDTRVSVIDPASLSLITEATFEGKLRAMGTPKAFTSLTMSQEGHPSYLIGLLALENLPQEWSGRC